ncbi:hypothetical protein ABEB36_010632 [Hypothenemus hampei]|uniref:Uncharacterized protein n=1 Tax=Hypothenemus hampei TaxID=57062 RepID=A0ABD1EEP3_HYPHA
MLDCSIVNNQQVYRETIILVEEFEDKRLLGGIDVIVEIDERKIDRRKYECGRVVEGCGFLE